MQISINIYYITLSYFIKRIKIKEEMTNESQV